MGGPRSTAHFPARAVIFTAVLSTLLFLLAVSAGTAQTLDLASYRQVLQSSLSSLQQDPGAASDVASRLREIDAVRMPDQSTIAPDLSVVVSYLEAAPPMVSDAEAALTAIVGQLDQARTGGLSPDRISSAGASLQSILARSEFQTRPKAGRQSLQGWVKQQLGRLLGPILDPLGRVLAGIVSRILPSTRAWTIGVSVIGLCAIVAVIAAATRGIRRGFGPATALAPASKTGKRIDASELLREAENLARANSYRLAIRALYLSALVRLDEQGVLAFDRSLTNREVLRDAVSKGSSGLADRLAPLVDRFDQHWYGSRDCTESDYREFARLATWTREPA